MGGTVTSTHSSCAGLSGNRRGSSVQLGEGDGELLVVALRSVLQDADGNLNQKQYNTLSDDDKEVLMAAEERGLIRLGKSLRRWSTAVWAFYVQVAVPMRLRMRADLPGVIPQKPVWLTSPEP